MGFKPLRFGRRVPKSDPEVIPLNDDMATELSMISPDSDLPNGQVSGQTSPVVGISTSEVVYPYPSNGVLQVLTDGPVTSEPACNEDLSLVDTYRVTIGVLMLKPVLHYIGILFLVKACFAASDAITTLKLIELGVSKERLAFLSMILLPLQAVLPLLITRWSNGPRPLGVYSTSSLLRLLVSSLVIPLIYYTPYFAEPVPVSGHQNASYDLNGSSAHSTTAHQQPQYTFSWTFYGILLAYTAIYSILANFMFVCQMAFHAKISDPAVGGTYMTLLNTAANMATILPNTILLYLVDPLSIRYCDHADPFKAGTEAWHASLGPNYTTLVRSETPPTHARLLQMGQQWIANNATCKPRSGVLACRLAGGECVTTLDGFYLEVAVCILLGLIAFPIIIRPVAKRLDSYPPSAYSFRLPRSTGCKGKRSCR